MCMWCTVLKTLSKKQVLANCLLRQADSHQTRAGRETLRSQALPRIQILHRVSECCVESVEVDWWVWGDSVERQSASIPVQMHSYLVGGPAVRRIYRSDDFIMQGVVTIFTTIQAPGVHYDNLQYLCKLPQCWPFFPIQPPSNSLQSDQFYVATGAKLHIALGDEDMASPHSAVSQSYCRQTGRDVSVLFWSSLCSQSSD